MCKYLGVVFLLSIALPFSQPAYGSPDSASESKLSCEEYSKFAEQAIRTLQARVSYLEAENRALKEQAQLQPLQREEADRTEALRKLVDDLITSRDLGDKECAITVNGEISCK